MKNKFVPGYLYHYIYSVFGLFGKGWEKSSLLGCPF